MDQGVGPGIAAVLGQEQPRPVARDRHERGAAGLEAMFPLLGESQALVPADGHVGVGHAQDRDDFRLHAGMISRSAAREVQQSGVFALIADRLPGIARALQEDGKGPGAHRIGHLKKSGAHAGLPWAWTNCRQIHPMTDRSVLKAPHPRHASAPMTAVSPVMVTVRDRNGHAQDGPRCGLLHPWVMRRWVRRGNVVLHRVG